MIPKLTNITAGTLFALFLSCGSAAAQATSVDGYDPAMGKPVPKTEPQAAERPAPNELAVGKGGTLTPGAFDTLGETKTFGIAGLDPAFDEESQVFEVVDRMPRFRGQEDSVEFGRWVASQVRYPEDALANGIQGQVVVRFIVEKDGSVSHTEVIRKVHPSLDAEALRVVQMSPCWTPAMREGKPVRVQMSLPVRFSLR